MVAGLVGRRQGYNCNLVTRDFWGQAQMEGDRATTAIWELEIFWWQAQLKGERATTAIWELEVFWWQAQCKSSCIALLSPEVRWSEMEWHVSLVLASRLSVRCEMNGLFYTSIFYRNECGRFPRPSCDGLWVAFYLGYIAISLRCSTERNLSGRLVSLAAWQFLLFHRFVPE